MRVWRIHNSILFHSWINCHVDDTWVGFHVSTLYVAYVPNETYIIQDILHK